MTNESWSSHPGGRCRWRAALALWALGCGAVVIACSEAVERNDPPRADSGPSAAPAEDGGPSGPEISNDSGFNRADDGHLVAADGGTADDGGEFPFDAGTGPAGMCTPQCSSRVCGDDGCGGACGSCGQGRTCSPAGACVDPAPAGSWLSGVASEAKVNGPFAQWRGRPVEIGGTWNDSTLERQTSLGSIAPNGDWSGWAGPLDVAIGAIYKGQGESWAKAAAGAYDARWRKVLEDMKSYRGGKGTTYIRFAHEFNGGYWEHLWQVTESEVADFKATWKRFRDLQKESIPEAKLVWCANDGTGSGIRDIRSAFPGAQYVDVLGIDTYNGWPYVSDAAEFTVKWNSSSSNGAPLGPESWRKFAEAQGVPLGIGEWGSHAFDSGGSGGGDSPAYMQGMHDWLQAHGGTGPGKIEYEVLFNLQRDFTLFPASATSQSKAAEKYRELW